MPVETGYVQKLTSFSGPSLCAWIGSSPASAELLVVTNSSGAAGRAHKEAMASMLRHACLSGRLVEVSHPEGSATVTTVAYPAAQVGSQPLQMDGLEVTQGIQDLGHSVPLIAGKRTIARVYLSYYGTAPISVSGEITVRSSSGAVPTTVASENSVTLFPADAGDLTATRTDASRSLNFILPAAVTAAGNKAVELSKVVNNSTSAVIEVGNKRRPIVGFQPGAPLRVKIIQITYQLGTPPVTYQPSTLDFDLLVSWLRRAYPASQVIVSSATVAATASPPFTSLSINSQLSALRAVDISEGTDNRTHYYGLVGDGGFFMRGSAASIPTSPDPSVVACGPTGPGTWGWDLDGSYGDWYCGHELGHTFGRFHPGFCNETADDIDSYPFPNGQISTDDSGFCGFDVGDPANSIGLASLPAPIWRDVMTYCDFQWVSPYTYEGIRRRLLLEDALPASSGSGRSPSPGRGSGGRPDARYPETIKTSRDLPEAGVTSDSPSAVSIVAEVNLTQRSGDIRYVNPVPGVDASPSDPDSPIAIRLSTTDGKMLDVVSTPVKIDSELSPDEDQIGIIDIVMLAPPGSEVVDLLVGDDVVDTFRSAGPPPSVRALRAVPAGQDQLRLSADLSGPAPEGQTFLVQVSDDTGSTWQTIAIGLREPSVTIDREQFEKGQTIQVRVQATNGFTSSVVATDSFQT